jgi:hypothetical protein
MYNKIKGRRGRGSITRGGQARNNQSGWESSEDKASEGEEKKINEPKCRRGTE